MGTAAPGRAVVGLWCLLVSACSPHFPQAVERVTHPSLGMRWATLTDGTRLPYSHWLPDGDGAKAAVIAVHGFNDYRRAFADFGPYLAGRGFVVYAYDQRGFGETAPHGYWAGTDALVGDLGEFVELIRHRHPGTPIYLLGESMGAAVALTALARGRCKGVSGAILVAPAVWGGDTFNGFYRAALWLGAHLLPGVRVTGRNLNIVVTDNRRVIQQLRADPLVIKKTRIDALYGMVGLMDAAVAAVGNTRVPLLVLYGERDEVIPGRALCELSARLGDRATVQLYPDGYHLLLRDVKARAVWYDIAAWLAGKPAVPSGTAGFCPVSGSGPELATQCEHDGKP